MSDERHQIKLGSPELDAIAREIFPTNFWSGYRVDISDRKIFLETLHFEDCSNTPLHEKVFNIEADESVHIAHMTRSHDPLNSSMKQVWMSYPPQQKGVHQRKRRASKSMTGKMEEVDDIRQRLKEMPHFAKGQRVLLTRFLQGNPSKSEFTL